MRVTAKRVRNAWIEGECGDYVYWAKVYDEPSHYGIKNGRISKLEIRDCNDNCVLNYDRGWDVYAQGEVKTVFLEIFNTLENFVD